MSDVFNREVRFRLGIVRPNHDRLLDEAHRERAKDDFYIHRDTQPTSSDRILDRSLRSAAKRWRHRTKKPRFTKVQREVAERLAAAKYPMSTQEALAGRNNCLIELRQKGFIDYFKGEPWPGWVITAKGREALAFAGRCTAAGERETL